jgi:flagellar motor switch protein FliM
VATICIPYASILPELAQGDDDDVALSDAERTARETTYRNMAAGLESAPIDVSVKFGSVRMRPEDIVSLRPGDVVPLDHLVTTPLTVSAADITFAHAVPGNQGSRLACLVVPPPKENTRA